MSQPLSEMKPIKQMKFMSANFDADSYLAPGKLDDIKLIKKRAFVVLKNDLLVEKRTHVVEGDIVSILLEYRDGTTDILEATYSK